MKKVDSDQIEKYLSLKNAPKGDPEKNFKVALYLVACCFHPDFSDASNFGVLANLLGSVGYKGKLSELGRDDYQNTLEDLCAKKALMKLGSFEVYAAPSQVKCIESQIRVREEKDLYGIYGEDKGYYVFFIEDEDGSSYDLRSKYVMLPKDEVKAYCIQGSGVAYMDTLLKKRACVLGRLQLIGGKNRYAKLNPDEKNLGDIQFEFASKEDVGDAKSGDVVVAEILSRNNGGCFVKTREVVNNLGDLNSIIVMAVLRNDIPSDWPSNLLRSTSRIPTEVSEEDWRGREDLRSLPLVTIDGEDARDFDDAVYCRREGRDWRLFVAIADVSYYVKPGTLLDKEAMVRCNSCYFPNYVIPMLPEKLSNGICSLNPDVDRLCMVCEMLIDNQGKQKESRFYPAVMRSHARLTYTEAWQMISTGTTSIEEHQEITGDIKNLYELYKILDKNRVRRGGISIEGHEVHFLFDENKEIAGIEPLIRNDAHKLIEECMVAANVAAATFVAENKSQTLYRVHAKPTEKKLGMLISQLARYGLSLTGGDDPKPSDFAKLYAAIANRQDADIIGEFLLRSMSKAEYTPENIGHFGLALDKYAHFTSPIRRYADLQLHRTIKYILEKKQKCSWGKIGAKSYTKPELIALGTKCTQRELAADTAEREVDSELTCIYLEKFIGEKFTGTITACTGFGVFVRLNDFMIDGMIYIGNFSSYVGINEQNQTLTEGNRTYRVGDEIEVILAAVDAQQHKLDLLPYYENQKNWKKRVVEKNISSRDKSEQRRRKAQKDTAPLDKEKFLHKIADISRPVEATEADLVKRVKTKDDWSSELMAADHYVNPLKMPSRSTKMSYIKSKKKSAFSGGKGKKKR
ncbi:MAG: ribonuclease R [Succinivibrio sp.]|nr:ribonuclease R [Succinivibrio sp.]